MAGCATPVDRATLDRVAALDRAWRDAVAVYLINSPLDPVGITGLADLKRAIRRAGFDIALLDYPGGATLAARVREAHASGRSAALLAWSGGSLAVHDALTELDAEERRVELVVYLDSNWIKQRIAERGHPANADRVVAVYRSNNPPPKIENVVVVAIDDWNHLALPRRRDVATALIEELVALAERHGGEGGETGSGGGGGGGGPPAGASAAVEQAGEGASSNSRRSTSGGTPAVASDHDKGTAAR